MSITGVTFDNQNVPPEAMGALARAALSDGWLGSAAVRHSGTSLAIPSGWFLAAGRVIRFPTANTVSVAGHTGGYARVRLRLDLNNAATAEEWAQGEFFVDYAGSPTGFSALVQQDLNENGMIYDVEICVVALSDSGISAVIKQIGSAAGSSGSGGDVSFLTVVDGKICVIYEEANT